MTSYWMGVLTLPALAIAAALVYLVWHCVILITGKFANAALRLGPEVSRSKRAHLAAATFAAKRGWVFGAGNTGLAIWSGMDVNAQKEAADALMPKVSLRTLIPGPRDLTAPRHDEDPDTPLS